MQLIQYNLGVEERAFLNKEGIIGIHILPMDNSFILAVDYANTSISLDFQSFNQAVLAASALTKGATITISTAVG